MWALGVQWPQLYSLTMCMVTWCQGWGGRETLRVKPGLTITCQSVGAELTATNKKMMGQCFFSSPCFPITASEPSTSNIKLPLHGSSVTFTILLSNSSPSSGKRQMIPIMASIKNSTEQVETSWKRHYTPGPWRNIQTTTLLDYQDVREA